MTGTISVQTTPKSSPEIHQVAIVTHTHTKPNSNKLLHNVNTNKILPVISCTPLVRTHMNIGTRCTRHKYTVKLGNPIAYGSSKLSDYQTILHHPSTIGDPAPRSILVVIKWKVSWMCWLTSAEPPENGCATVAVTIRDTRALDRVEKPAHKQRQHRRNGHDQRRSYALHERQGVRVKVRIIVSWASRVDAVRSPRRGWHFVNFPPTGFLLAID
eukprot:1392311-Amorphochlora_amoeboformis.AAC.2